MVEREMKVREIKELLRRFFGRRAVQVFGIVALVVVVVVLLFLVLNWYVAPTKSGGRKDLVLAVAQILGGTALLSGLYFTWRTLQVNREGQITERYTRAIEQLGSTEQEIRIGGIYALERIARDSERDHETIMAVLTAYVRHHAAWQPAEDQQGKEDATAGKKYEEDPRDIMPPTDEVARAALEAEDDMPAEPTEVPAPEPDIEAIMNVLRRRTRYLTHGEREPLLLGETNLSGANLVETNLQGASLWRANLSQAMLYRSNLSVIYNPDGKFFHITAVSEANLCKAYLREADLTGADLRGADLREANLREADLRSAKLSGADLRGTDLVEAVLSWADLSGADLSGARLGARGAERLGAAKSLDGTTMPDGRMLSKAPHGTEFGEWLRARRSRIAQKYEDWLKDREDRKEDTGGS